MAKIYIYDATELDKSQISAVLEPTDHEWEYTQEKLSESTLHEDAEAISVFVDSQVTSELIEKMPKLRLIACRSTGFNNVDVVAASSRDITVVNVPTYGESTVAEYAFTLLLSLSRKIPETLNREIEESRDVIGNDLNGKTLGVIGVGHIGQHSISIAKGFEMNVVAYDPYPNEELENRLGFKYQSLEEVLKNSDAITIHAPYNDSTHHLISKEQFELMKNNAFLINTARGEIVDTKALIEALNDKQIRGAALDVIEGEALLHHDEEMALLRNQEISSDLLRHGIEISTLKRMPNVIITPHNAFNTVEAVGRINQITGQNIIDYWYGVTPNAIKVTAEDKIGKLIVVRHAESEWNASGQWTGITDVHLSETGFHQAALLGIALKDLRIKIDKAYVSEQIRTRETLESMLSAAQKFDVEIEKSGAINERDYGDYTGKNKWEMKEQLGEEKFNSIRRGWNEPINNGETLKDVYERAVPFYKDVILPQLLSGKNIMLVAHGNSIRSLMKYIESISDSDVANLEMLFGDIVIYEVKEDGLQKTKKVTPIKLVPKNA